MVQAAVTVDRLTKRYGDSNVVDDLSFSLPPGMVTGFRGRNGSGKTTTVRLIFGLIHPTSGTALIDGVPFEDLAEPARHAVAEPRLLVLDEPANGLDPAGIRWLRTFLQSFAAAGGTVFVSSHQRAELSQLGDEVVVINHGRLVTHTAVGRLTSSSTVKVDLRDVAGAFLGPVTRYLPGQAPTLLACGEGDAATYAAAPRIMAAWVLALGILAWTTLRQRDVV